MDLHFRFSWKVIASKRTSEEKYVDGGIENSSSLWADSEMLMVFCDARNYNDRSLNPEPTGLIVFQNNLIIQISSKPFGIRLEAFAYNNTRYNCNTNGKENYAKNYLKLSIQTNFPSAETSRIEFCKVIRFRLISLTFCCLSLCKSLCL